MQNDLEDVGGLSFTLGMELTWRVRCPHAQNQKLRTLYLFTSMATPSHLHPQVIVLYFRKHPIISHIKILVKNYQSGLESS